MKRLTNFIKSCPVYFSGYAVSALMFWLNQGPKAETLFDFGMNAACSLVIGLCSWVYPVARILNAASGG